jgi:hypothetical protein
MELVLGICIGIILSLLCLAVFARKIAKQKQKSYEDHHKWYNDVTIELMRERNNLDSQKLEALREIARNR